MKYINRYLIIILLVFVFTGCDDNFLDRTDPETLSYDKFYTTEDDFQAALNACYYSLKDQVEDLLTFNDEMTDNAFLHSYNATSDLYYFDHCNVPTSSSTIENFWGACYSSIAYANLVITRIVDSEVSESTQKVFTDEAKFIRAYSYFNLVRIYGGVPKYEQEVSDLNEIYEVGRSSVDEIYNFIINDLEDAMDIDSERTSKQAVEAKGKASSTVVKALLGKVYLQKGDYENAITILADVITNSGLELEEDIANLYDPDDPYNNNETLFAINYERVSGQESPFTTWTLPKFSSGILPNVTSSDNGDGEYNLEPSILAKFSLEDKRRSLIDSADITVGADVIRYYYTKKYLDLETTSAGYSASDFIVFRYADVLLIYADALNQDDQTSNAYTYINEVRSRAGLDPLPSGYTQEQMNDALANERQLEFLLEGDRWFDLSYRGIDYLKETLNNFFPDSYSTTDATIEDYEELFPLPADEVNLKPDVLTQNTGY